MKPQNEEMLDLHQQYLNMTPAAESEHKELEK